MSIGQVSRRVALALRSCSNQATRWTQSLVLTKKTGPSSLLISGGLDSLGCEKLIGNLAAETVQQLREGRTLHYEDRRNPSSCLQSRPNISAHLRHDRLALVRRPYRTFSTESQIPRSLEDAMDKRSFQHLLDVLVSSKRRLADKEEAAQSIQALSHPGFAESARQFKGAEKLLPVLVESLASASSLGSIVTEAVLGALANLVQVTEVKRWRYLVDNDGLELTAPLLKDKHSGVSRESARLLGNLSVAFLWQASPEQGKHTDENDVHRFMKIVSPLNEALRTSSQAQVQALAATALSSLSLVSPHLSRDVIEGGVIAGVVRLVKAGDLTSRIAGLHVLNNLATERAGASEAVVASGIAQAALNLVQKGEPQEVLYAGLLLSNLASSGGLTRDQGSLVMEKLRGLMKPLEDAEADQELHLVQHALKNLAQAFPEDAAKSADQIRAEGLQEVAEFLRSEDPSELVQEGLITVVRDVLEDADGMAGQVQQQAKAFGAEILARLASQEEHKAAVVAGNVVSVLVPLLDSEETAIQALQALLHIAQTRTGVQQLRDHEVTVALLMKAFQEREEPAQGMAGTILFSMLKGQKGLVFNKEVAQAANVQVLVNMLKEAQGGSGNSEEVIRRATFASAILSIAINWSPPGGDKESELMQSRVVQELIGLLSAHDQALAVGALVALEGLARRLPVDSDADAALRGGIQHLIAMLDSPDPVRASQAATAIWTISGRGPSSRTDIVRHGALKPLVQLLQLGTAEAGAAAGALASLGAEYRLEIMKLGALPMLHNLAESGQEERTRQTAAFALHSLGG